MNPIKLLLTVLVALTFANFAFAQDTPTVSIPVAAPVSEVSADIDPFVPVAIPVVELTAVDSPAIPDGVEKLVLDTFTGLVQKFPWLATIILVMGMLRFFAKPLSSLVHSLVDLSPSKFDDNLFNSALKFFNENPIGKMIAFGIDWLTSIKIKPPANKTPSDK